MKLPYLVQVQPQAQMNLNIYQSLNNLRFNVLYDSIWPCFLRKLHQVFNRHSEEYTTLYILAYKRTLCFKQLMAPSSKAITIRLKVSCISAKIKS